MLVAGGLFGFLPLQETITADALVARAVANDRQCPCPRADMVTIAASPHAATPTPRAPTPCPAGDRRADTSASRGLMSERGAHARELAERLAEYAFDWQAPLSARPYQEWRSAITARTESYDWIASDRVRVSTHAASGRIERAELILAHDRLSSGRSDVVVRRRVRGGTAFVRARRARGAVADASQR